MLTASRWFYYRYGSTGNLCRLSVVGLLAAIPACLGGDCRLRKGSSGPLVIEGLRSVQTSTGAAGIEPAVIEGTLLGFEVNPELFRVRLLLGRGPERGGLGRVHVRGTAEAGRDALVRSVVVGIEDCRIKPGEPVRFVTTGIELTSRPSQHSATSSVRWTNGFTIRTPSITCSESRSSL
jgi:hypothetical protein